MSAFVKTALAAGVAGAIVVTAAIIAACAGNRMSTREVTAVTLDSVLAGGQRSPENRARDPSRHPKETLLFFGLRPEMQVVEVWPDPSGWYTEVIAPLVREKGKYYAAVLDAAPGNANQAKRVEDFRAKLATRPDLYDRVEVTKLPPDSADLVPPGSVDMVVTFRNIHNWMARGSAPQAFTSLYKALKPGGTLGVVEHRGNPAIPQDPQARNGYVNEQYAIDLIESVGFKLVAKSEVNANPRDTKDYEQGVWTLPPVYRLGDKDREKYAAIGESDRFTLRFVKPGK
ncbi:MAG: methyltransferase [Gammaproteobacteria bacterium]